MDIQKEKGLFKEFIKHEYPVNFQAIDGLNWDVAQEYEFEWKAWLTAKAQAIPEGFVLVPREPTLEMCHRGRNTRSLKVQDIYKAMIEAQEQSHESKNT